MHPTGPCPEQDPPRDRHHQATLYASLELSRSTWLVTSLAPGDRKMSKHSVAAGDGAALLALPVSARTRRTSPSGNALAITPRLMWSLTRMPAGRPAGMRAIVAAPPRTSASMAQPCSYVNRIGSKQPRAGLVEVP